MGLGWERLEHKGDRWGVRGTPPGPPLHSLRQMAGAENATALPQMEDLLTMCRLSPPSPGFQRAAEWQGRA